jgi:hypothetical protein
MTIGLLRQDFLRLNQELDGCRGQVQHIAGIMQGTGITVAPCPAPGVRLRMLAGGDVAESLTGQFHERFSEQFDLMIKGKSLIELKKYRLELTSRGTAAGEIPDETFFGHHLFCKKP